MTIPPELHGAFSRDELAYVLLMMMATRLGVTEEEFVKTLREYVKVR